MPRNGDTVASNSRRINEIEKTAAVESIRAETDRALVRQLAVAVLDPDHGLIVEFRAFRDEQRGRWKLIGLGLGVLVTVMNIAAPWLRDLFETLTHIAPPTP